MNQEMKKLILIFENLLVVYLFLKMTKFKMKQVYSNYRQVREMCSPQQFRQVALYRKRTQGRPQQAELSGAANADEEMDDGAVRFR